jgi:hypothetical protein
MININQLQIELTKKGKSFTYVKVKKAIEGVPNSTTEKEKKEILSVLDEHLKKIKDNISKS